MQVFKQSNSILLPTQNALQEAHYHLSIAELSDFCGKMSSAQLCIISLNVCDKLNGYSVKQYKLLVRARMRTYYFQKRAVAIELIRQVGWNRNNLVWHIFAFTDLHLKLTNDQTLPSHLVAQYP